MSKEIIPLKENYFIMLYNEWDKIVSNKQNLKKTKDSCVICNSKKNKTIFIKKKIKFLYM